MCHAYLKGPSERKTFLWAFRHFYFGKRLNETHMKLYSTALIEVEII